MNLKITANVKSAVSGLKRLSKASKKTNVSMGKIAAGVAGLGAAFAGIGIAAAIKTIKSAGVELAILGDRLAKQARMVGVTTEQYQGFEFAAKRSGTSITAVANGLKKLGRVMVDSRNGSRQMKDTFAALGIELMNTDGTLRDVNDVFLDFADRSQKMGASAERTGVTMLLLGRSGTELTNMMSQGAKGITDMKDVLEDLGAIMSEDFLRASEELVDVQADLEHAFRGVKIGVGTELIPALSEAGVQITEMIGRMDIKKIGDFTQSFLDLAMGISLATDHWLGFGLAQDKGFVSKHEADLRSQSRMLEDLAKNVTAGTLSWQDYVKVSRGLAPEINEASDAFRVAEEAVIALYGSSVQSAMTLAPEIGKLTTVQIAQFQAVIDATGSYLLAEETMVAYKTATEDQAKALTLLFQTNVLLADTETELAAIRKKLVEDNRAVSEEARKAAEARGLEIRRAISSMDRKRQKEKAAADATRAHTKAIQDQIKWLKALNDAVEASQQKIYDMFYKSDESELTAKWSRENDEISKAMALRGDKWRIHGETVKAYLIRQREVEALELSLRAVADKRYSDGKLALVKARIDEENKLEREKTEKQLSELALVFDATSTLFSTMSGLAMQAHASGDAEAKKHAVAMFAVSQAAALATATINMALAISGALANFPYPPASIPQAVAAGIMGAAQIATIVGTSVQGIGDAGITTDMLKSAGMNNHSAIVMRNDETLIDPVGTRYITEMLAMQKSQMQGGGGDQTIRTTVEIDGRVLGESVDTYMIRQQERGLAYGNRVRQEYV